MGDTYYGDVVFSSFDDPAVLSILHSAIYSSLTTASSAADNRNGDWFPGIFCTPSFIKDNLVADRDLQIFVQSSDLHTSGLHVTYTGYGTTGEQFIQCICNIMGLNCILSYGRTSSVGKEHILFPQGSPIPYKLYGTEFITKTPSSVGDSRISKLHLSDMPKSVAASIIISQARSILEAAGHLFKHMIEEDTELYELTLAIAVSEGRKYLLSWYNNYMLDLDLSNDTIRRSITIIQSLESLGDIYNFTSAGAEYSRVNENSKKLCRAMLLLNDLLNLISPAAEGDWVRLAEQQVFQTC